VLSSGYFSPDDTTVAERLGVNALVVKPNTTDELVRTLRRLFGPSRTPPEGDHSPTSTVQGG